MRFLTLFVCWVFLSSEANASKPIPPAPQLECIQKTCIYRPQFMSPEWLVKSTTRALLGRATEHFNELNGFIEVEPLGHQVFFYYESDEGESISNQKILQTLVDFDQPVRGNPFPEIKFFLMIYQVQEGAYKNIGLSASGVSRDLGSYDRTDTLVQTEAGSLSFIGNIGNLASQLLRINLDMALSNNNAKEFVNLDFSFRNHESIQLEKSSKKYLNINDLDSKEETDGIYLQGTVQITEGENPLIQINDFDLSFSRLTDPGDNVLDLLTKVEIRQDLVLQPGVPVEIYSENVQTIKKYNNKIPFLGIPFGEDNKVVDGKLVVFIYAEMVEKQLAQSRKIEAGLGSSGNQDFQKFLDSIKIGVLKDFKYTFWQRLRLSFDEKLLPMAAENVSVKVVVSGDGFPVPYEEVLSARQLALLGFDLPNLDGNNQQFSNQLKLKVQFEAAKSLIDRGERISPSTFELLYVPKSTLIELHSGSNGNGTQLKKSKNAYGKHAFEENDDF